MKQMKTLLVTALCAAIILAAGYGGIVMSSQFIMQNSEDLQPVNMSGNSSTLFYSRMSDDIELYPWNCYPTQEEIQQQGDATVFDMYDPTVEYSVFYTMIAIASQTDVEDVSHWYGEKDKTIMMSMVKGYSNEINRDVYFYDEIIRLDGKKYEVKIACNRSELISFSCIQCYDENIKESEEWDKKKEEFLQWMEEEPEDIINMFGNMTYLYDNVRMEGTKNWSNYEELYQYNFNVFHYGYGDAYTEDEDILVSKVILSSKADEDKTEYGENTIRQVIELKESIMVIVEDGITMGLHYDIINNRLVGFHYFY